MWGDFWGWNLLSLEARPLAALLEGRFAQAPQLRAPARDLRDSHLLYIEDLFVSAIAHSIEVSLLVRPAILQPSTVA